MTSISNFTWDINAVIAFVFGLFLLYMIGRIFLLPIKIVFKLIYNGCIGGLMLWALNFVGGYFNFTIAINPFTALIAGFLGIPGVILLALFKIFIV